MNNHDVEKIFISLKIEKDVVKRLDVVAEKLDRSRSWVIRSMLLKGLQKTEKAA